MDFTTKEFDLIYAALMFYGNEIANQARKFSMKNQIKNLMTDRAKEAWKLAEKVVDTSSYN